MSSPLNPTMETRPSRKILLKMEEDKKQKIEKSSKNEENLKVLKLLFILGFPCYMAVNSTDMISSSNEKRMMTIEYTYLSVYFGQKGT